LQVLPAYIYKICNPCINIITYPSTKQSPNLPNQKNKQITNFTTAVFDLHEIEPETIHHEPDKTNTLYYYRPWKTIMARTVADGGKSYYIKGHHRETVSALYRALI
jgi:hypothetical protein